MPKHITPVHRENKGFIALMAVLIISMTLLGASFTLSSNGFFSRLSTLDAEYKRIGLGLSESCVNVALLKISQNYNYTVLDDPLYNSAKGGVVIPVNPTATSPTECIIKSVAFDAEDANHQKLATIITQGKYNSTLSNMKVSANIQNPDFTISYIPTTTTLTNIIIDSWGELGALP